MCGSKLHSAHLTLANTRGDETRRSGSVQYVQGNQTNIPAHTTCRHGLYKYMNVLIYLLALHVHGPCLTTPQILKVFMCPVSNTWKINGDCIFKFD